MPNSRGPVAVCLPKRAHRTPLVERIVAAAALPASWVIVSLGGARIVEHRRVQRARPRRAYLYERIAEGDHEHAEQPDSPHVMRRGTSHDAAQLVRGIIAARDDRATHRPPGRRKHRPRGGSPPAGYAASPTAAPTPFNPGERPTGTGTRKPQELVAERQRWIDQRIGRDRSQDQGLDDGIDL